MRDGVLEIVPLGTSRAVIAEKVRSLGIGADKLSSYHLLDNGALGVIRIEYDPKASGLVKSSWIITLEYVNGQLKAVEARRYHTGP